MDFTNLLFLFIFLPIALVIYHIADIKVKEIILLAISLLFYALGSLKYLLLFVTLIVLSVGIGRGINLIKRQYLKRVLLVAGIIANLVPLLYYKYTDFSIETWNQLSGQKISLHNLALPLGISFFTFKAVSYLVDIYRNTAVLAKNPLHDALYLSFFTQVQSGPLSRYNELNFCMNSEIYNRGKLFSEGASRFMIGFSKKILLANMLAMVVDEIYATPFENFTVGFAWLGSICYSLQLFFDFSGYSDMAIGLTEMFGYRCKENFIYPYTTESVSKFWRKWHISLSEWFRDYIYIPMGGSRSKHAWKVYFNLLIVWLLTGIWHGANWTFVVWGLGYFVLISFEKLVGWPERFNSKFTKILWRIVSLFFINVQWILFRSKDLISGFRFIKRLFICNYNEITNTRMLLLMRQYGLFIILAIVLSTPVVPYILKKGEKNIITKTTIEVVVGVIVAFAFIWSISLVLSGLNNPFAYANF